MFEIKSAGPAELSELQKLIEAAFENAEHADGTEHLLVAKLMASPNFVPELSIGAQSPEGAWLGHVLFTPIEIKTDEGPKLKSLAQAPVSVLPSHQKMGIGKALILHGHKIARERGYDSVIVLGSAQYYPRWGYRPASEWGIRAPFEVPSENFMAVELIRGSLSKSAGIVQYPPKLGFRTI